MMQTINIYFACAENPNLSDYYYELFEGLNCLAWEAANAKLNIITCNWNGCRYSIGVGGFQAISPGI